MFGSIGATRIEARIGLWDLVSRDAGGHQSGPKQIFDGDGVEVSGCGSLGSFPSCY
jgi:hypothetical protein